MQLTDVNWEALLGAEENILVLFYAEWCGACALAKQNLEEFGKETGCTVGRLDLIKNPKTTWRYMPNGVPYYALFKEGECVKAAKGVVNLIKCFKSLI